MEVASVELFDSSLDVTNSQNATYTQIYRVKLTGYDYILDFQANMYAEFFILADSRIPQDYDKLEFGETIDVAYKKSIFRCVSRSIKRLETGDSGKDSLWSVWYVTVTWTANIGIVTGAISTTSRLISIDYGYQPYDFSVTKSYYHQDVTDPAANVTDEQGSPTKPIVNTAGDPPSEVLESVRNIQWLRLELEYKEEYFDTNWLNTIFNTMNLFKITVCDLVIPALGGKITIEDRKTVFSESEGTFWIIKLLIETKEEGWQTEWLNAGFNQTKTLDKPEPILKQDMNVDLAGTNTGREKIDDPAPLNILGLPILPDTDPIYNKESVIYPQDWTVLDLPTSLKGE